MEILYKSIDYIFAKQSETYEWADFEFRPFPGCSNEWVTSYIIQNLFDLKFVKENKEYYHRGNLSLDRIENLIHNDRGWGYSSLTRTDADSTSNTILAFVALNRSLPNGVIDRLISFQRTDGGFATFDSRWFNDYWGVSHNDVSATALFALSKLERPELESIIKKGIGYVLENQNVNGVWDSYWWESSLYPTRESVRILKRLGIKFDEIKLSKYISFLLDKEELSVFEMALMVEIMIMLDFPKEIISKITKKLILLQNDEGFWQNIPFLRFTYDSIKEPWNCSKDWGYAIHDQNNLFTTSTVIHSINSYYTKYGSIE